MTSPRSSGWVGKTDTFGSVFLFDDHLDGPGREVEIEVYGDPAPQGSKSGRVSKLVAAARSRWTVDCPRCGGALTGVVSMRESSKHVKRWRRQVAAVAKGAVPLHGPLDGPVVASVVFSLARRAEHLGTGRNAGQLRPSAPPCHVCQPDIDKLLRAALDAVVQAGVLADDSRIWRFDQLAKVYAGDERALPLPGVVIRLRESDQ